LPANWLKPTVSPLFEVKVRSDMLLVTVEGYLASEFAEHDVESITK
jgi:hypothetical protein